MKTGPGPRTDPAKTGAWRRRTRQAARDKARENGTQYWRPRARTVVPHDWKQRVFAMHGDRCFMTGARAQQAHHVVSVSTLIREGLEQYAGDPRNGLPLTRRAHERHELAVQRISRDRLPASALKFAAQLGFGWYIDRYYPEAAS